MKQGKNFLAVLLTAAMVVGFAGCGADDDARETSTDNDEVIALENDSADGDNGNNNNNARENDAVVTGTASADDVTHETSVTVETDENGETVVATKTTTRHSGGGSVVYDGTADATNKTTTKSTTKTTTKRANSSKTTTTKSKSNNSNSSGGSNSSNNSNSSSGSGGSNSSNNSNSSSGSGSSNSSNNSNNSSGSGGSNSSNNSNSSSGSGNSSNKTVDDTIYITLSSNGASSSSSSGVSISGSTVTLTAAGKYEFTGTVSNGQIIVNASKSEKVDVYLNGVSLQCSASAPIYVMSADTCTIHLVDGSTNYIADTANNEKNAAIFSKDDLTFKGAGQLTVVGNKKHAIKSSNDVKIKNGTYSIAAVSAGVFAEDNVQVTGGSMTITTCKDGLKASDSTDKDGTITFESGYLDVQNAAGNGMQADVSIVISGGSVNVHSVKKGLNCNNAQYASGCYAEY